MPALTRKKKGIRKRLYKDPIKAAEIGELARDVDDGLADLYRITEELEANSGDGTSTSFGSPVGLTVGGSNVDGVATTVSHSDHEHELPDFGTSAGEFCEGNDSRLSDARTPSGAAGGQLGGTFPNPTVNHGTTAATACAGDDARLSDDRTASGLRTASTVVAISSATAPTSGQILTATGGSAATWQSPTVVANYYGVWASLPAAGNPGRAAIITNSPWQHWIDTGLDWRPVIDGCVAPPCPAPFIINNNASTSVLSFLNGVWRFTAVSGDNGNMRGWDVAVTSSTPRISVCIRQPLIHGNTVSQVFECGVYFRRVTGGAAMMSAGVIQSDNSSPALRKVDTALWSGGTFGTRTLRTRANTAPVGANIYLRIERVGTDIVAYSSPNGVDWFDFDTVAIATAMGASSIGFIGVYHLNQSGYVTPVFSDFLSVEYST